MEVMRFYKDLLYPFLKRALALGWFAVGCRKQEMPSLCILVPVGRIIAFLHALFILVSCASSKATLCHLLSDSATAIDPSARVSIISVDI